MRLTQLFDGSTTSDFILIHDDKGAKAGLLLSEFVKQNVNLKNNIHLLSLEKNPTVSKNIPKASNLKQYFFNDYNKWLYNKKSGQFSEEHLNPLKVLEAIQKNPKPESKTVIVIDSLSLLVLLYPDVSYRIIYNLVNQRVLQGTHQEQQVICLLHTDVLPGGKRTSMMFEQLAVTNLYVSQDKDKSVVTTNHRKASGRIIQTVEQFCIDKSTGLMSTKEIVKTKENVFQNDDDNIANINSNVTFKLGLEDHEKQARSELVLPYLKMAKPGSGEIVYEPDANDDWDEEDPDDDLNI